MSARKDLKAERYWIYQAEVKGTYMPRNILKLNDFELKAIREERKSTIFMATLKVYEEDINIVSIIADEKFAEIFNVLSLVTGGRYEYIITSGKAFPRFEEKGKPSTILHMVSQLPFSQIIEDEKTRKVSKEAMQLLSLSQIDDQVFQKAFEYFIIGTKISKWHKESFLNFFKAIELISDHFKEKLENDFKEKIQDLTRTEIKKISTAKRRIMKACEILNVENIEETEIKEIVKKRPDAAHPRTDKRFGRKDVELCKKIAREFILKYLKYSSARTPEKS